jgi:hypothetical protein
MTTTITTGSTTITPVLVLGWETSQESRNIIHSIIGRSDPDVTLQPANLRTATLQLFFTTEAEAEEARTLHSAAAVFYLDSDEIAAANLYYVVSGSISAALEDETRKYWIVSVDYQEITV